MIDLWPNDISLHTDLKAPVTILREQGTLLGRKTNNIVEGMIVRDTDPSTALGHFKYGFYLTAPALSDYRYRLLTIMHSFELYPLDIIPNEGVRKQLSDKMMNKDEASTAKNEEEFTKILKEIFATKKARRVIEAIIAQST